MSNTTPQDAAQHNAIDYQGAGQLLSAALLQTAGNLSSCPAYFQLLVDTGSSSQPFCVAKYYNGQRDRENGRYFDNLESAQRFFAQQLTEWFAN